MKLLFDIGGTNMRVGISRDGATVDAVERTTTPAVFEDGVKQLQQLASKLTDNQTVERVSGGIAGVLSKDKDTLFTSPNLAGWVGKPLQKELEHLFQMPVHIENDAALAGLGEATLGAGQGINMVAYITVSTGVGGALVVNQKIAPRAYGFEPGKIILQETQTLEDLVSGAALQKKYGQDARTINDAAVWEAVLHYLAVGLHTITMLWSPEVIVVGGGLVESGKIDLVILQAELQKTSSIFPKLPQLKKAQLGDISGLTGALHLGS